jgi:uncharacterized protein
MAAPRRRWLRVIRWSVGLPTLLVALLIARGLYNATRDPIVRTASVVLPNWPANSRPLKILLLSDVHVAGPDMPPERLARMFRQLNASKPDLMLLAGDFVSEKRLATRLYSPAEVAAPFAELRAPLGVVAVPGNHDHWSGLTAIVSELRRNGVTVIANEAIKRGPLIIGGVDDEFTNHDNLAATYAAMDALDKSGEKAPRLLVTHSPDIVPDLPAPVAAVMTGHTHCGQIVLPLIGAVANVSHYGNRFACGDISDTNAQGIVQRVFVSAGLGTSVLPLRFGAPPDVWLVTLKGSQ